MKWIVEKFGVAYTSSLDCPVSFTRASVFLRHCYSKVIQYNVNLCSHEISHLTMK